MAPAAIDKNRSGWAMKFAYISSRDLFSKINVGSTTCMQSRQRQIWFPHDHTTTGEGGGRTVKTAAILALPSFGTVYFPPLPQQFHFICSVNNERRKKQHPWQPCRLLPISLWFSPAAHTTGMGCSVHVEICLFLSSNKPTIVLLVYRT